MNPPTTSITIPTCPSNNTAPVLPVHAVPHHGRGLLISNAGGRIGWITRRRFPRLSTRLYLFYIRTTRARAVKQRLTEYLRTDGSARLSHIELETANRCNGECAFCPVNRRDDPRPHALMDERLFSNILRQLAAVSYPGYLGLFSNNEPLLDKRLEAFAAEARKTLPDANLNLSTNGRLLTLELFRRLIPYFNHIVINNYHDRPEMFTHIKAIHDYCRTPEGEALLKGKTVEISLRNGEDVLTSRAGSAPNRSAPAKPLRVGCVLPFTQMVVRPDGKVSLCCNDALGRVTLGDLSEESLGEVWNGEGYRKVRKVMAVQGRGGLGLCRGCDFVKHTVH